jgi:hypothetical protein
VPLSSTLFAFFDAISPFAQFFGVKFAFKIKTEPALHTTIVIAVVVTSSGALATIAVSLANPSVATYCVTVLALIIWITVTKTSPRKNLDPDTARPLALALAAPTANPRILQLSPLPREHL